MKNVRSWILICIAVVLGYVVVAVVSVMLIGLFDEHVNNDKVFSIIGPAFQMVIGAFVGFFARDALEKVP